MIINSIIAAAGEGKRFRSDKLFYKIGDKSLIYYTIKGFDNSNVDRIVIAAQPLLKPKLKSLLEDCLFSKDILIVEGGAERHLSVYSALEKCSDGIVCIHDGARPLITPELINKSIEDCIKYGSSVLAVQVNDTMRKLDSKGLHLVDRENLYAIQTPQTFFVKELKYAYERLYTEMSILQPSGWRYGHFWSNSSQKDTPTFMLGRSSFHENPCSEFTDDAEIMIYSGKKIHLTNSSSINIKVTSPEDIEIIKAVIQQIS